MPTGVVLHDARMRLFAAAERVLLRAGAGGLTSRAVTEEAEVAKGVLHRHFADFDDFLAELVRDRVARVQAHAGEWREAAGSGIVASNLAVTLGDVFEPVNLGLVGLVIVRDGLRSLLRTTTPRGLPILTEAAAGLAVYLEAEQRLGRVRLGADVHTLALTLIGTGHLLFAGERAGRPDASAVQEAVRSALLGAEPPVDS